MVKEGKLTKRQKDILEYIKKFSAQKKYPPSIREIAANFSLSSPATAHVHVKKLIEKGYLKRGKGSNHLLELQVPNEFENKNDDVVTVPLLGKVTAGNPIEAIETPNEVISLPTYLLPKRKEVFTIKVEGDSMINAGIYSKDIVIVERGENVKNGDITGSILGSYDDYSINCQIKKGETNLPSKKDGGYKQLDVIVNNGDAKIEINK